MQSSQESLLKANLTAPPNPFNLDYAKLRFNMPNLTGMPYDNVANLNRLSEFVARSYVFGCKSRNNTGVILLQLSYLLPQGRI